MVQSEIGLTGGVSNHSEHRLFCCVVVHLRHDGFVFLNFVRDGAGVEVEHFKFLVIERDNLRDELIESAEGSEILLENIERAFPILGILETVFLIGDQYRVLDFFRPSESIRGFLDVGAGFRVAIEPAVFGGFANRCQRLLGLSRCRTSRQR